MAARHTTTLLVTALACLSLACPAGDDGETSSTSTSSTTSTSSGETTTDTSNETGDPLIPCGELECEASEVCLTFPQEPNCMDKPEGEPCPEGTTETQCGGAGLPCCCEPTPPAMTECHTPEGCEGTVDCSCLAEVCVPMCSPTGTEGVFICESPPPP